MPYYLLFCLTTEDTGSVSNPKLTPIVAADGRPQVFNGLDDAHRALNRLRRLADGLVYYVRAATLAADFYRIPSQGYRPQL